MRFRGRIPGNGGRAQVSWLVFLASLVVLVLLLAGLLIQPRTRASDPLVVYCAAGLKGPLSILAQAYEKECHTPIQLTYGGSGSLLANIEVSKQGDLYLPADESYLGIAKAKNLVVETLPLARMQAVLAVRRGNPKHIVSLSDLERSDVVLAQANPEAAAIGKLVRAALQKAGAWDSIQAQTQVFKPTVNEVANDIKLGTVDAGFVWNALLALYPELEAVPVDSLAQVQSKVTVGVLRSTRQPAAALRFARFLQAPERGFQEWNRQGFVGIEGDRWTLRPEIRLLSGAMLRPAIEETIQQFEQREGVQITRVYNGCGILVSQMKAGERPDAYFSCDRSFMTQVSDLFLDAEDISQNQLVIAVAKGNPREVHSLEDLAKPGLRVGLGHPQKSALGALTQNMLRLGGVYDRIQPNLTVDSPTGDFLVNQLRTGALDAIIVYRSNTLAAQENLEVIPVGMPSALATQPIAVGRQSPYKYTAQRLFQAIKSAESKSRFESHGFLWRVNEPTNR